MIDLGIRRLDATSSHLVKIKKAKKALFAARSTTGKIWGPSPKYAKWAYTSTHKTKATNGATTRSPTSCTGQTQNPYGIAGNNI
jgi:hypothetical protein